MDHIRILKRAFSVTTSYRALWIFGILLALTAGFNGSGGDNGGEAARGPREWASLSPDAMTGLIVAGVVLLAITLVLIAAAVIARYVSETALIRMVDQHEATGVKVGVRQGIRLGWTRAARRLFVMDLALGLSGLIAVLLLAAVAASPLLVWLTDNTPLRVLGTVLAAALGVVVVFAAVTAAIALSLLVKLWHRAVVLEDRSVNDAVRRGGQLLRQRLGDVGIMGVILFGLGLAKTVVLVPVVFLLVAVAVVGGGLPAMLAYAVTGLITQGATPVIAAAIVGVPIVFLVIAIPLALISGLVQTFQSSTWTLTYRELASLDAARQSVPVKAE